jgi:hypothetical protein
MKRRAAVLFPLALAVFAGCSGAAGTAAGSSTSTRPSGHTSTASADPKGKRVRIPTSKSYKVSTPPASRTASTWRSP